MQLGPSNVIVKGYLHIRNENWQKIDGALFGRIECLKI